MSSGDTVFPTRHLSVLDDYELLSIRPVECQFNAFLVRKIGGWCYHPQCVAFVDAKGSRAPFDAEPPAWRVGRYQTRPVLAGAYGGRNAPLLKAGLTHLCDVDNETALCGKVKPGHLVDSGWGSDEQLLARPTCARCGKLWDGLRVVR